jgi:hypothetical protein
MVAQVTSIHAAQETATDDLLRAQLKSYREELDRLNDELEKRKDDSPYSLELIVAARNQVLERIREIEQGLTPG